MGGRTTPPRSPYKPSQVPHSAQGRLKSQKAAFPLGEEVRISRLGLKPAPRSEKAAIGSTEINGHRQNINENQWKSLKIDRTSMKINDHQLKINENQRKSNENQRTSTKINENKQKPAKIYRKSLKLNEHL